MDAYKNISDRSLQVLQALRRSSGGNGFDFGFMDEALDMVRDDFTRHQFAGHIADLKAKGYIDWSDDLRRDNGVEVDGVQFGLSDEVVHEWDEAGVLARFANATSYATGQAPQVGDMVEFKPKAYATVRAVLGNALTVGVERDDASREIEVEVFASSCSLVARGA